MKISQVIIALLITLLPIQANARLSGNITVETFFSKNHFNLETSAKLVYSHSKYYGTFVFFKTSSKEVWSEALGGIEFYPHKNVALTIGAGVEEDDSLWRTMGSIYIKTSFGEMFFALEYGASGVWYGGEMEFHILHLLNIGAFLESHHGLGPMLKVKMPYMPLSFFVAPLFNYNHKKFFAVIGMKGEI